MKDLKNQVVIVTGGAAGIGAAITTVLVDRGASVIAVDINDEAGERIAAQNPNKIVFLNGDVSKMLTAEKAVALAISKFGKLTGLVNNAHASRQKPLMELTEDDWALSFGTGLNATLYFMKAQLSRIIKTWWFYC